MTCRSIPVKVDDYIEVPMDIQFPLVIHVKLETCADPLPPVLGALIDADADNLLDITGTLLDG